MSTLPKFTMKELLDAGVHFGHKTMRWNPSMAPYIYGARNNIHIINLQKTVPLLHNAMQIAHDVASKNGRILFVSTKRQASPIVAEAAKKCGQYYVNHRWLGGMLTNWGTISKSIKTLSNLEAQLEDEETQLNKKERLQISRKINKLELALGGIKSMGGVPNLIFVIDTNRENIAILEANKLGIPVIAIADSNSSPEGIDHLIPGNDDATRSIQLYCDLIADSILGGLQKVHAKKEKPEPKPVAKKAPIKKEAPKKEEAKKEEAKPAVKAEKKKSEAKKVESNTEVKKPTAKAKASDKKDTTKKAS